MVLSKHYLSKDKVTSIRDVVTQLNKAYWQDRSAHKPNLGIDGSIGRYYSCGRISCPELIRQQIDAIAPEYVPYGLEDWVINWMPEGGFIPPHIDNEGYLAFSVLSLQSGSGQFVYYQNNELTQPVAIPDQAGQLVSINDITTIHSVPPALTDRYTIIFLYQ